MSEKVERAGKFLLFVASCLEKPGKCRPSGGKWWQVAWQSENPGIAIRFRDFLQNLDGLQNNSPDLSQAGGTGVLEKTTKTKKTILKTGSENQT